MKNSKIKLLTATACLALVGTASAAWVYSGTATESANIGVKVASYASAGDITVTGADNYYLYLDYGSVTWKQKETGTNLVATHNKPSVADDTKTVTYNYTITLKGNLAEVVKFSDTNINNNVTNDSDNNAIRTSKAITWESGTAITLPALEWETDSDGYVADAGKTYDTAYTDEAKYKDLITRLNGTGVGDSWDKNQDIDVGNLVEINFTATVA